MITAKPESVGYLSALADKTRREYCDTNEYHAFQTQAARPGKLRDGGIILFVIPEASLFDLPITIL
jgi:hypothetical protein